MGVETTGVGTALADGGGCGAGLGRLGIALGLEGDEMVEGDGTAMGAAAAWIGALTTGDTGEGSVLGGPGRSVDMAGAGECAGEEIASTWICDCCSSCSTLLGSAKLGSSVSIKLRGVNADEIAEARLTR